MMGDLESYLAVGAVLFVLGAIGFFTRRNLIVMVLSAEMMLHGVSLTLVTFGRLHASLEGQAFTIFILTVAACEAGLALALVLALYQRSKSLDVEFWTELREPDLPPPMLVDDAGQMPMVTPPARFPRLTPAGRVPENLDTGDRELVDDAASQTADVPTEPPQPKEVIKSVSH
ncbi:MAG TPA: NADH-quinone oxidoreductase subunit NuoK [Lacipirellulaceae bacterium]|nr:NADH-quinone oxidoreductase subunit NuoK [Lacipirellulaceae bacterium]